MPALPLSHIPVNPGTCLPNSIHEPVFTIPERTRTPIDINQSATVANSEKQPDRSFVPFPERVITDIPHVVSMPWESVSQLSSQPLMFSAQAQAAAQSVAVVNTSLTAVKKGPRGKVAPSLSASLAVSLRTKPAPISFDEIFISPLAVYKDLTLLPELEGDLLAVEADHTTISLLSVDQPEPSLGGRLADIVIGTAYANPALLTGLSTTAAQGASAGLMQASMVSLNRDWDDYAAEYNAALNPNDTSIILTSFPMLVAQSGLGLFRKSGENDKVRPNAPDPDKRYVPAPKELPGFPDASKTKSKTYDADGKERKRWKLPGGEILEWDKQHGEVEIYTPNGIHKGGYDPVTGNIRSIAKSNRRVEP